MSYTFWKMIHFSALFVVLLSLGAIACHQLQGGNKANFKNRRFFMMLHGIGLLVAFVAGFGLIAKAGYQFTAGWIWGKIAVWLLIGVYPVVLYKMGRFKITFLLMLAILFSGIYLVEYKPF